MSGCVFRLAGTQRQQFHQLHLNLTDLVAPGGGALLMAVINDQTRKHKYNLLLLVHDAAKDTVLVLEN